MYMDSAHVKSISLLSCLNGLCCIFWSLFFASLSTDGGKLKIPPLGVGWFDIYILMDIMLPQVSCSSRFGRNEVLFCRIMENTLSSSAFECGMVSTRKAILESLGNRFWPSGLFIEDMWLQIMSGFSLESPFPAASITALDISFSSIIEKSFTSSPSCSISTAVPNGRRLGYLIRREVN